MRNSPDSRPRARRKPRRHDRVQSVERALAILSTFDHDLPVLGITEIARRVGLTKGVVFRAVRTMVEAGFLEQVPGDGVYRIGLRAFEVGSLYPPAASLEKAAQEPMQELAVRHGHNVYLGVRDGIDVVYVATVEGRGPIKVHAALGSRIRTHASAMGKVLLASLPAKEVRQLLTKHALDRLTPHTITDVGRLERQLEKVRRNGFAVNRGETYVGVGSVAAPVRDRSGAVVASVSNGFPLGAEARMNWNQLAVGVVSCADAISRRLVETTGGRGPLS
jgi:IclR family KDG regulon transcriptional repressor